MSTLTTDPSAPVAEDVRAVDLRLAAAIAAAAFALALVALLIPDLTVGAGMGGMAMTHYMGLLAANQPWNLIIFMAIPVILAETLAITELALLFGVRARWVAALSRWAGIVVGPLILAIGLHLMVHAVVPLTVTGGWRGVADVVAVASYLLGAVPLIGITLVELGLIGRTGRDARKWHAVFVGAFLVVAHVAMIFGMLDPTVLGWVDPTMPAGTHVMPDGSIMSAPPR